MVAMSSTKNSFSNYFSFYIDINKFVSHVSPQVRIKRVYKFAHVSLIIRLLLKMIHQTSKTENKSFFR